MTNPEKCSTDALFEFIEWGLKNDIFIDDALRIIKLRFKADKLTQGEVMRLQALKLTLM